MERHAIVDLLGKTALFGPLTEADRTAIAARMRRVQFEPDQMIFSRGDAGREIYLVLEGRVRLSILSSDGRELSLDHASVGDIFGEIAAFDGGSRTAGATATTNLPFVTIMTPGGDADGANPLENVTVIFTIGAANSYDPDSQAQLCDATGTVPASGQVSVKTDANGVATLPCLKFGTLAGFANLSATFDPAEGGFGGAPKFPRPVVLNFLLRYHARTGTTRALEMTLNTLRGMANGGLHDHLGGGFHRYATDRQWRTNN